MQTDEETMETMTDFIFFGSKITADGDCSHEIKRRSLEEKLWKTMQHTKKQRHYFTSKGLYSHKGFDLGHTWSSGFLYFLQFQSEFGNKEFMIWATVSFQSCFCWLCIASSSLVAKNIVNLISVLQTPLHVPLQTSFCSWPFPPGSDLNFHEETLTLLWIYRLVWAQGSLCDMWTLSPSPCIYVYFNICQNSFVTFSERQLSWHFMMLFLSWRPVSCTMSWTSFHSSSGTLSIRSRPLNLFLTSTV